MFFLPSSFPSHPTIGAQLSDTIKGVGEGDGLRNLTRVIVLLVLSRAEV
jgi:hypothetical protein